MNNSSLILPNLYEVLNYEIKIDKIDWSIVTKFAENWKLSVADALLDLNYIDESTLARCLARSHNLPYIPSNQLKYDFSEVSLENFDDLMSVGAAPLEEYRLAICNPYDDHRGYLDNKFCEREMIVTERSSIIEALRKHGFNEWIDDDNQNVSENE
ncbi:hypothetical protein GCL60_05685 [Silvanigrella paludirubra]|uniref:Type II secretion system protein GspE N-terminal domain-containing protein n=1 Tax=Silvanigrella paludirubra TaxID=2499159 RepID=A0A6N6VV66_9BACT|nr:hypothetical protein [Silvanigrella paludirubra]KAB8039754.1 hypothetical protein GCL60_05685 [Silvanigrella paludirubra]